MPVSLSVRWDKSAIAALEGTKMQRALVRALRKAGATALRDMGSEASKRVRARKRIRPRYIRDAMTLRRAQGSDIDELEWAVELDGRPVPLIAYPHRAGARGVTVEVNKGKRTLLKGSFVAQMRSGHKGVFRRRGPARLPIDELRGSRPVDALLHRGESEAVAERGGASFAATFDRVLPIEIAKLAADVEKASR
jgi:hypothetical protein